MVNPLSLTRTDHSRSTVCNLQASKTPVYFILKACAFQEINGFLSKKEKKHRVLEAYGQNAEILLHIIRE